MKLFYKLFLSLFLLLSFSITVQPVFSSDIEPPPSYGTTFGNDETEPAQEGEAINIENPDPVAVVGIIERILIIALSVVGLVFVAMIGYGAIKAVMAAGDPRGLQAGKQTWTNAFFGFMIITLVYVILNIVVSLFGGTPFRMDAVFNMLREGISDFLYAAGIYTPTP